MSGIVISSDARGRARRLLTLLPHNSHSLRSLSTRQWWVRARRLSPTFVENASKCRGSARKSRECDLESRADTGTITRTHRRSSVIAGLKMNSLRRLFERLLPCDKMQNPLPHNSTCSLRASNLYTALSTTRHYGIRVSDYV